ncbi:MAG TPA: hypothetical protein H9728_00300 [Candidatus Borkfalkia excrementavium]|uniref:Uncharacterized protein n=1 Tax=Candidatus Borkfalkia excrementavium TaxID=2838505 RepID=A0A9D1Z5X0_9FIRM|nr:hypothetical protein [Candidatus Borkfalkia excrementavium]
MKKKKIAKKTIILYVLKILQEGSSPIKPITISNITHVLNSLDIPCDRKTVGRNINYLIEFGYPIKKLPRGGCYYENTKISIKDRITLYKLVSKNITLFENQNICKILGTENGYDWCNYR